MLEAAFFLISAAVLIGIVLALLHMRGSRRPHWLAGAAHGGIGATGLTALLLALRGPPRGVLTGVESFGAIAAVLAAFTLEAGLGVELLLRRNRTIGGLAIAVHATLAITAYVMLAAYLALG
jgi:hypothetical protein